MNIVIKLFNRGKSLTVFVSRNCSRKAVTESLIRHRNIGIMAHVDAGKTTTTERILFYSGEISTKGEVHDGNTVTDYLEQERNRGISITSAFVKFKWKDHVINLVDTPGHIDFTAEVENALGVIDAAILLLDASAGVEAQTLTVWNQIRNHNLPCMVYINKMDRTDADVDMCTKSLQSKLHCEPLLVQLPILDTGNRFKGVIDLPSLDCITWDGTSKSNTFERYKLNENHPLFAVSIEKRNALIDRLSTIDDELANTILNKDSLESVSESELLKGIKNATLALNTVPVICGSSYKDMGIQQLLDAIVQLLPSPHETKLPPETFNKRDQLLKSFKIMHDKQRGALTFVRVYSGDLSSGQKLYNTSKEKIEQVGKILVPFADDFEEIPSASAGQYVAVTGLKDTHSNELLSNSVNGFNRIRSQIKSRMKMDDTAVDHLLTLKGQIPQPVFFCSVEVSSQAYQQTLDKALRELQREDSSLSVTYNNETSQTILSGMGELHLEIIKDRLKTNYKLDVDLGTVQIMYKEKMVNTVSSSYNLTNSVGPQQFNILIKMSMKPKSNESDKLLHMDNSAESASNLAHVSHKQLSAIERGVKAALSRGPVLGYQVIDSPVTLHWLESKKYVPDQLLTAAASHCVKQILSQGNLILLEPIMLVEIVVQENRAHSVIADLGRRRAEIRNIENRGENRMLQCEIPTSELVGYSSTLRTITSGTASFLMAFSDYRPMPNAQVAELNNFAVSFKKKY